MLFFTLVFFPFNAKANIQLESQREAIVTARSKEFYKNNRIRQYLSLGGKYSSDYNSKEREINSQYLYQSYKFINEINFENNVEYADSGSGANRSFKKRSELYDASIANKIRISDSRNYGVFFHRTIYDDLSSYYYDLNTAAGVGRMFFNEAFHLDISIGQRKVKDEKIRTNIIPSFRTRFQITENLQFIQRGYWFLDNQSTDNELRTSLLYKINKKVFLELRHNFEQRRYEQNNKNIVTNLVNRSLTVGLTFKLD